MKLLVDQNLSHRLPARLSDLFSDSAHVRAGALDRAERHLTVLGRLAGVDAELVLERLQHLLRADERSTACYG